MSDKYVIKNCENYDNFLQEPTCNKYPCDCQTITDCKLKQIVELCKERTVGFIEEGLIKDNILKLLDIQEVE